MNMNTPIGQFWERYSVDVITWVVLAAVFGGAWQIANREVVRIKREKVDAKYFAENSLTQCREIATRRTDNECIIEAVTGARSLGGDSFAHAVGTAMAERILRPLNVP